MLTRFTIPIILLVRNLLWMRLDLKSGIHADRYWLELINYTHYFECERTWYTIFVNERAQGKAREHTRKDRTCGTWRRAFAVKTYSVHFWQRWSLPAKKSIINRSHHVSLYIPQLALCYLELIPKGKFIATMMTIDVGFALLHASKRPVGSPAPTATRHGRPFDVKNPQLVNI